MPALTVICTSNSGFEDMLTEGKQYNVAAHNFSMSEVMVTCDDEKTRYLGTAGKFVIEHD